MAEGIHKRTALELLVVRHGLAQQDALSEVRREIYQQVGGGVPVKRKLADGDFRFVERLLYDQKTHDTAIAELKSEMDDMVPSATSSVVQFSADKQAAELTQPENAVEKRLHSIRGKYIQEEIAQRQRHQKAISEAMKALDDIESQLVWLFYHLEKSARASARVMGYEKSRWYEMRKNVVFKVARFLGI